MVPKCELGRKACQLRDPKDLLNPWREPPGALCDMQMRQTGRILTTGIRDFRAQAIEARTQQPATAGRPRTGSQNTREF